MRCGEGTVRRYWCDRGRRKWRSLRSNDSLVTGAGDNKDPSPSFMRQTGEIIQRNIGNWAGFILWSQFTEQKHCSVGLSCSAERWSSRSCCFSFGGFCRFMKMTEVAAVVMYISYFDHNVKLQLSSRQQPLNFACMSLCTDLRIHQTGCQSVHACFLHAP